MAIVVVAQDLADSITAAQGSADDNTIQKAENLKVATGIANYLNPIFAAHKVLLPALSVTVDPSTFSGPPAPLMLGEAP